MGNMLNHFVSCHEEGHRMKIVCFCQKLQNIRWARPTGCLMTLVMAIDLSVHGYCHHLQGFHALQRSRL